MRIDVPEADRRVQLTFLAPPAEQLDWRLALAYDAAADVMARLPASMSELCGQTAADPTALAAVLRLLEAWKIVVVEGDRVQRGALAPDVIGHATLRRHAAVIRRWAEVLPGLVDVGTGAEQEATPQSGALDRVGLELLARHQRPNLKRVVEHCDVALGSGSAGRVLDLGGGHGEHALALAQAGHAVTMQDLPSVVEAMAEAHSAPAGVSLFPGDARTVLPEGPFDLVLLSAVTNMFDESTNRDIFVRLGSIVAAGGSIVIATYLRDSGPLSANFAVQMAAFSDGGDAHSIDDLGAWLAEAGFDELHFERLGVSEQSIVRARRSGEVGC